MIFNDKRGTALLVSMLIMGVLMAVSLLVSSLVLRENRVVLSLINSGKAYYAAESGVELSLYGLNTQLPGWQPSVSGSYKTFKLDEKTVFEYQVDNRCSSFPCFKEEDYNVNFQGEVPEDLIRQFYYVLDLNETLSVPLFVVSDDGESVIDVDNFRVQFFSELEVKSHLDVEIEANQISGWDVLRWKVLGFEKKGEAMGSAEVISDFTAFSDGTGVRKPSWFGSVDCSESGRLDPAISCVNYQQPAQGTSLCFQTEARGFDDYVGDEGDRDLGTIHKCYGIKQFLDDHTLNYLTLTNMFNPAVLKSGLAADVKDAVSKIYVRVELFADQNGEKGETVREVAEIESHGYSGENRQSLEVFLRRGVVMPVFNFSLYSTDSDSD